MTRTKNFRWFAPAVVAGCAALVAASPLRAQVYPPVNQEYRDPSGRYVWAEQRDVQTQDHSPGALAGKIAPPKIVKRWDASNVDEIKDMLMPTMYERVKKGLLVLNETEYKPYTPWSPWVEATKQYAPTVLLGSDEELVNYRAGVPFPVNERIYGNVAKFDMNDPQQGLKLAHNQDQRWQGDNFWMISDFELVDSGGGVRNLANSYSRLRLQGRVANPPTPVVGPEENPLGLRFMELAFVTFPNELQGFFSLQYSYMDRNHQDDFYLYVPSVRRVRRASAAQRYDTFAGTDITYEDFMGFNGFVHEHTYKVVTRKPMYMVRHQVFWYPRNYERQTVSELYVEPMKDVIIYEQYPKNEAHPYSKRVFYYDPEVDQNLHWEAYDRKGRLWKSYLWMYNLGGYNDNGFPYLVALEATDYLGKHATFYNVRHEGFIKEMTRDAYDLEKLQVRGSRGRR